MFGFNVRIYYEISPIFYFLYKSEKMQYLHKKETSSMSEFAYKIRSEELALSN